MADFIADIATATPSKLAATQQNCVAEYIAQATLRACAIRPTRLFRRVLRHGGYVTALRWTPSFFRPDNHAIIVGRPGLRPPPRRSSMMPDDAGHDPCRAVFAPPHANNNRRRPTRQSGTEFCPCPLFNACCDWHNSVGAVLRTSIQQKRIRSGLRFPSCGGSGRPNRQPACR